MEAMLWINTWGNSIIALFVVWMDLAYTGLNDSFRKYLPLSDWWIKMGDGSLIIYYSVVKRLVKAIKLRNDQICCKLLLQSLKYKACYY